MLIYYFMKHELTSTQLDIKVFRNFKLYCCIILEFCTLICCTIVCWWCGYDFNFRYFFSEKIHRPKRKKTHFAENLPSAYHPELSNALHKEMQIGNDYALASTVESYKPSRVLIANDLMLFKYNTFSLDISVFMYWNFNVFHRLCMS